MTVHRKTLNIVLGDYPHSTPLKRGEISSPRFDLAFTEITPTYNAFKPMVREQKFDICEMAIVTYLLAKAHGKPIHLLPAVMIARFQHPYAIYNAKLDLRGPGDLAGRRVGVRSYTTTTVSWLRGMLANDYGADLGAAQWTSFEEPHVAEYRDPTTRAPAGQNILQMLLDEELDVVLGESSTDPRLKPLFADPAAAARGWYEKHRVAPINHLVTVSEELVRADIGAVGEFYAMMKQAKAEAADGKQEIDFTPIGIEAVRPSLELIIDYAAQQKVIPQKVNVDELFDDRIRKAIGE